MATVDVRSDQFPSGARSAGGGREGGGRRSFLRQAGLLTGATSLIAAAGGLGFGRAFAAPLPAGGPSPDTTADILNGALTAEQLATTFYYAGLTTPAVADGIQSGDLDYFQAALYAEYVHASTLASVGAKSLAGTAPSFHFPSGTFSSTPAFLQVLDALENAFIQAYAAAIGEWAGNAPAASHATGSFTAPQLAMIASQFLGVEAEHRALGRAAAVDIGAASGPPNNLVFERAGLTAVGSPNYAGPTTAVGALLPFVTGGPGFSAAAVALPTAAQVQAAATAAIIAVLATPPLASAAAGPLPPPQPMPGMMP